MKPWCAACCMHSRAVPGRFEHTKHPDSAEKRAFPIKYLQNSLNRVTAIYFCMAVHQAWQKTTPQSPAPSPPLSSRVSASWLCFTEYLQLCCQLLFQITLHERFLPVATPCTKRYILQRACATSACCHASFRPTASAGKAPKKSKKSKAEGSQQPSRLVACQPNLCQSYDDAEENELVLQVRRVEGCGFAPMVFLIIV